MLYVIAWLFYGITWYTMSVFHGIEWYCMMLQWSSTLIYQLRAQGQNQIIIFETWHKPLFACWPILQSHFLLFYKKKAPPLAGSDGQKQIF